MSYNGPPRGLELAEHAECDTFCPRGREAAYDAPRVVGDCVAVHAEANALTRCGPLDCENGILYTTRLPCWACAHLVANSGIIRVVAPVVREDLVYDPKRTIQAMRRYGMTVDIVEWEGVDC